MNLIALVGFRNTPAMQRQISFAPGYEHVDDDGKEIKGKGVRHPEAVNKGDRISISGTTPLAKITDQADRILITRLMTMGLVESSEGDDGKRTCERVDTEVKEDLRRQDEARKAVAAGSLEQLINTAVTAAVAASTQTTIQALVAAGLTLPKNAQAQLEKSAAA